MKTIVMVPVFLAVLAPLGARVSALLAADEAAFAGTAADPCAELSSHVNTHIRATNRDDLTIRLASRNCELDVRIRGTVEYTGDFRGIASVSIGGEFVLEETSNRVTRSVRFENDGRGGLETRYRVGRESRPFDGEAREWLAERLLVLYRQAGLAADQRAPWVLARGGLDGLITEASRVQSSRARRSYLGLALEQPHMDARRAAQVLGSALPSSSSGKVDLLLIVAERYPMQGSLGDAYLAAAGTISSSSGRRRVLAAALDGGGASQEFVRKVVESAGGISSSSQRSELLVQIARDYRFDDELLAAYLTAASGISSSSSRTEVLRALLSSQRLQTPRLARVLRAAGDISSSSSRADVLVSAAAHHRIEGVARDAYMDAALAIGSRSHRDRAILALERATPAADG
jgi:hypothetical protein